MMHAVSELQDGGKYVAMEGTKPFKKVAYCATETTQTSPLHKKSLRYVTMNSHPHDMYTGTSLSFVCFIGCT